MKVENILANGRINAMLLDVTTQEIFKNPFQKWLTDDIFVGHFSVPPFSYPWNILYFSERILNMIKPQQVQVYQHINAISMVGHIKNVHIRAVTIRQNVTSVLSSIFEVILVNDLTNVTNVNTLQSLPVIWRSTIEPTRAKNHSNVHIVTMHAEQGEILITISRIVIHLDQLKPIKINTGRFPFFQSSNSPIE